MLDLAIWRGWLLMISIFRCGRGVGYKPCYYSGKWHVLGTQKVVVIVVVVVVHHRYAKYCLIR